MPQEPLARAGVLAFAFTLAVPFVGEGGARADTPVTVAAYEAAGVQAVARAPRLVRDRVISEMVAGVETTSGPLAEPTAAPAEPASGIVLASWYGPGFYGNRTACGQTYTPAIIGVAHTTLPCGTLLALTYGGRTVTVPVIDRGPYVDARTLDLSNATRLALGCPDLCTLSVRVAQ